MKFRIFGGLDCPDWVLGEMSVASRLTALKVRQLCQELAKWQTAAVGPHLHDSADVSKARLLELGSAVGPEASGAAAGLAFVLGSAVRSGVEGSVLAEELQQLGLPPEHAAQLRKVYVAALPAATKHRQETAFRLPPLSLTHDQGASSDRVALFSLSSEAAPAKTRLAVHPDQLRDLTQQLRDVCQRMEQHQAGLPPPS